MKTVFRSRFLTPFLLVLCVTTLGLGGGCTVKKNTGATRLYHNLTTRYNVHYNGQLAFDEAYRALLENEHESYTRPIAVDIITYKIAEVRGTEKKSGGTFDRSVEKAQKAIKEHSIRIKPVRKPGWRKDPKAVAEQLKGEYNPFLHQTWLLLGKAQLYNADVDEAMATFAYISRLYESTRLVRDIALLWQVRCLSLADRASEGKQLLALIDTTDRSHYQRLRPLYTLTMAEYHLARGENQLALPWLTLAAPLEPMGAQRARLYYLLGQLQQLSGEPLAAYRSYGKVLALSPKPTLDFAARIRRAELSPRGHAEVLGALKSMARRGKYKTQLDQIYYAIGSTYLSSKDTLGALDAFRFAVDTSQTKGQDYALANIALGQIYLQRMQYLPARDAYAQAISALSQLEPSYKAYSHLAQGLDSLAVPAEIVHREDSVLALARMDEQARTRVIDSVITTLKAREAEEAAQRARDSIAQLNRDIAARMPGTTSPPRPSIPKVMGQSGAFYFYNQALLNQGRKDFDRTWGRRKLEDLWRLRKRDGFVLDREQLQAQAGVDSPSSSLAQVGSWEPSQGSEQTQATEDPHHPAYYLSRLPMTPQAQQESEAQIEQNLVEMGRLLTDKLERLADAAKIYHQTLDRFPKTQYAEQILYRLYLLYLRQGDEIQAEQVRQKYLAAFPQTKLAAELSTPNYLERLRERDQIIARRYAQAYEAYHQGQPDTVLAIYDEIKHSYPTSTHLPRLLFLSAMAEAAAGHAEAFGQKLEELQATTPAEEVKTLVDAMLEGLKQGRPVYAGHPIPINWTLASGVIDSAQIGQTDVFAAGTPQDQYALLVVGVDSLATTELIYRLAVYNFTKQTQSLIPIKALNELDVSALATGKFASMHLLRQYANQLRADDSYSILGSPVMLPITHANLSRLNRADMLDRYLEFLLQGTDSLISVDAQVLKQLSDHLLSERKRKAELMQGAGKAKADSLDFGFERVQSSEADTTTSEQESQVQIPRESALARPAISYEEMQTKADEREKRAKQEARKRERLKRAREKAKTRAKKGK
ncbi:MAG: hypothetical protein Q4A64_05285 [Porphyromonadaceae bacterium]|nr:hypothetical protein [Porphyromonadaceae bacterium]